MIKCPEASLYSRVVKGLELGPFAGPPTLKPPALPGDTYLGVLPVASIIVEFAVMHGQAGLVALVGKWFVFRPVGVRLILAGLRQIADPTFTAATIFGVKEEAALTIVQELGYANLSIGMLGALSLIHRE